MRPDTSATESSILNQEACADAHMHDTLQGIKSLKAKENWAAQGYIGSAPMSTHVEGVWHECSSV
jgi:hypothetical protein